MPRKSLLCPLAVKPPVAELSVKLALHLACPSVLQKAEALVAISAKLFAVFKAGNRIISVVNGGFEESATAIPTPLTSVLPLNPRSTAVAVTFPVPSPVLWLFTSAKHLPNSMIFTCWSLPLCWTNVDRTMGSPPETRRSEDPCLDTLPVQHADISDVVTVNG